MQYVIIIFIAILAWPVTLVCLGAWVIFLVIRSIYKNHRNKIKSANIQAVATDKRKTLHDDWRLFISIIAISIKQHWDTIEAKFEQHIDEDEYGNRFIDDNFSKEIIYFSHKVVLPALNKAIGTEREKANNFALLPTPSSVLENLYGIKYDDLDTVIASKYVRGLLNSDECNPINDEFLYALSKNVTLENGSNDPLNKINLKTLNMCDSLQASKSMKVTHLAGIVFMIFYSMYNSKPMAKVSKHADLSADFSGNDPYKYEEFIKKSLQARGFIAKRTRGSGDYGVDVIASKKGKTFAIQCKLYNHTVGFKAVQEIVSGRIYYKTDFALVVSDNSFTDAAKNMARRSGVILTHHKNLLNKLEGLIPDSNETHDGEIDESLDNQVSQELETKKQWTQSDADELITVVLPIITNNGK